MVMPFINDSNTVGQAVGLITTNVTGSIYLTLFLLLIIFIAILAAFRVSIEWIAVIILPFVLAGWAYTADFQTFGGLTLILLAVVFIKKFIF